MNSVKEYIAAYEAASDEKTRSCGIVVSNSGDDIVLTKGTVKLFLNPVTKSLKIKRAGVSLRDINSDDERSLMRFFSSAPEIDTGHPFFGKLKESNQNKLIEYGKTNKKVPFSVFTVISHNGVEVYEQLSSDLTNFLNLRAPIIKDASKWSDGFFYFLLGIEKRLGVDAAKDFIDIYSRSSMRGLVFSPQQYGFFNFYEKEDPHKFFEFICFDMYRQGYRRIQLNDLIEYLVRSSYADGSRINPYPLSLATELKLIQTAQSKIESGKMAERIAQENYEKLREAVDAFDISYSDGLFYLEHTVNRTTYYRSEIDFLHSPGIVNFVVKRNSAPSWYSNTLIIHEGAYPDSYSVWADNGVNHDFLEGLKEKYMLN